ncbi:hypothetical protein T492DRAFT_1060755 [Pavlovales sp. CCMP2436]|nr:hypothetical protein T492DRAFT_1060755 [Pavlovales sp. CCMP2436]
MIFIVAACIFAAVNSFDAQSPRALHVLVGTLGEGPNNWIFSVRMGFVLARWLGPDAKAVMPCVNVQGALCAPPPLGNGSNASSSMCTTASGCVPFTRYWNVSALEAEGVSLDAALRRLERARETVCFFVVRPTARFAAAASETGDGYVIVAGGMVTEPAHARALRSLLDAAGATLLVLVNGDRKPVGSTVAAAAENSLAADLAHFKRVRGAPRVVLRARWLRAISSGPNGTVSTSEPVPRNRAVDEFIPPVAPLWAAARAVLLEATGGAPFVALHWRVELMRTDRKTVEYCLKMAGLAVARELAGLKLALPRARPPGAAAAPSSVLVMSDMPDLRSCDPQIVRAASNASCTVWTRWRAEQYASPVVRSAFERAERTYGWALIKRYVVPELRRVVPALDTGLGQLLVEQLVSAHASVFVANVIAKGFKLWTSCSQGRSTASYVVLIQKVVRGAVNQTSWR